MKRFLFFTLLFICFFNTFAQKDSTWESHCIEFGSICPRFSKNINIRIGSKLSVCFWGNNTWMFGGTFQLCYFYSNRSNEEEFMLRDLQFSATRFGLGPIIKYKIPSKNIDHSIAFKTYLNFNKMKLNAYDERFVFENSEGDISHNFTLERTDGQEFINSTVLSVELSYVLNLGSILAIELSAGCDITPSIRKETLQENASITSRWKDFENYYGTPTINLAEQTVAGRIIDNNSMLYFGITIIVCSYR